MGWLELNRTRNELRKFHGENAKQAKRHRLGTVTPPAETPSVSSSPTVTLESLPKELLEKIFIYSENLDLVHISRQIFLKLEPHFYLESQFVLHQVRDGVAPGSVLMLPFIRRELLEHIKLRKFQPMTIPHSILSHGRPELIAYLLECGLNTDDHALCYDRLIELRYVKLLVNKKYIPSASNIRKAIELGNKYSHRMVALTDLSQTELQEIWDIASRCGRKRVLKELESKL